MIKDKVTIDFKQWTKAEKPEPKSLEEIQAEVGFPFSAKAVITGNYDPAWPIGSELFFNGEKDDDGFYKCDRSYPGTKGKSYTHPWTKRWILLGHK